MNTLPDLPILFARLGTALLLGFLIGLEREREKEQVFAGMRTFALISLLGGILALLDSMFRLPYFTIAGFLSVAAFTLLSYLRGQESGHTGITTEVVFMLAYLLGVLAYHDLTALAAAITVVIVMVLAFKPNLQAFAARISQQDLLAAIEFAIVWIVILPILPDQAYGPFDVLNPRSIWMVVVFITGINTAAYVLGHLRNINYAIGLTGLLGGIVSSTAVTVQLSRRSKLEAGHDSLYAIGMLLSVTGMLGRVFVLTLLSSPWIGLMALAPTFAGGVVLLTGAFLLRRRLGTDDTTLSDDGVAATSSPFAIQPALQFALVFAAVLVISRAAQLYFDTMGVYASGIIGGAARIDALVLTIGQLARSGLNNTIAIQTIAFAIASNLVFKCLTVGWLGAQGVSRMTIPAFVLAGTAAVAVALLVF